MLGFLHKKEAAQIQNQEQHISQTKSKYVRAKFLVAHFTQKNWQFFEF